MAKILLAEDDNSLREIYGTRLLAEGYDIVSAPDGEAALQMAAKEKPDLILSDVMMPRISGFEMIDILRSQDETKNIKVIIMTALSTDGQRERGESLGVDKYLVKSQVGIEDVVAAVHEVLGDAGTTMASTVNTPDEPIVSSDASTGPTPSSTVTTAGSPTTSTPTDDTTTDASSEEEAPPPLSFDSGILAEAANDPLPTQEQAPVVAPEPAPTINPDTSSEVAGNDNSAPSGTVY
jgi:DNA-binding response OmpR family regulator